MHTLSSFSPFLSPLAAPFATASMMLPSCVDSYPESTTPSLAASAAANTTPSRFGLILKSDVPQTLCDIGNETWNAVDKNLTCGAMTADALRQISLTDAHSFLNQFKTLFATASITSLPVEVHPAEFDALTFALDEPSGRHHIFEIFIGQYEAIMYLYLDASFDPQQGYSGSEYYGFTLAADSFDLYHFLNGDGCMKCADPDLTVRDSSRCAQERNASLFPQSVSVIDMAASASDTSGSYGLACATEDFSATCKSSSTSSFSGTLSSDGAALCAIAPNGQKNQHVRRHAVLNPSAFSRPDMDALFFELQAFLKHRGYDLLPFER